MPAKEPAAQGVSGARKLLLVDDDSAIRRTLCRLVGTGCAVLEACSGAEALRIFERDRPQLVLLDISLPDMNGVEVLQIMRTIDPNLNIIILTGRDDIELAKRTLEIGAMEFITKPFESDSLQTKIGRLLEEIPTRSGDCGRPWRMSS